MVHSWHHALVALLCNPLVLISVKALLHWMSATKEVFLCCLWGGKLAHVCILDVMNSRYNMVVLCRF